MTEPPTQNIDEALLDLVADNEGRANLLYRPVLFESLKALGYPEPAIIAALNKLYRMH